MDQLKQVVLPFGFLCVLLSFPQMTNELRIIFIFYICLRDIFRECENNKNKYCAKLRPQNTYRLICFYFIHICCCYCCCWARINFYDIARAINNDNIFESALQLKKAFFFLIKKKRSAYAQISLELDIEI